MALYLVFVEDKPQRKNGIATVPLHCILITQVVNRVYAGQGDSGFVNPVRSSPPP